MLRWAADEPSAVSSIFLNCSFFSVIGISNAMQHFFPTLLCFTSHCNHCASWKSLPLHVSLPQTSKLPFDDLLMLTREREKSIRWIYFTVNLSCHLSIHYDSHLIFVQIKFDQILSKKMFSSCKTEFTQKRYCQIVQKWGAMQCLCHSTAVVDILWSK